MTIDVRCYSCGAAYHVSDDKAGKKLRCSECRTIVSIPSRPHTLAVGFNVREVRDAAAGESESPSGLRSGPPALPDLSGAARNAKAAIIIAAVGGGVVLLAGLIVGIVFAVKAATGDVDSKTRDRDRGNTLADADNRRAGFEPASNGGGGRTGFAGGGTATATVYNEHLRWIASFSRRLEDLVAATARVTSRSAAQREAGVIDGIATDLNRIVSRAERRPRPTAVQERDLKGRLERELARIKVRLRVAARTGRMGDFLASEPSLQRASRRIDSVVARAKAVYR